ncbi:MAG: glycosyltransferase, partial [Cyanophyceae cyanobacterium]
SPTSLRKYRNDAVAASGVDSAPRSASLRKRRTRSIHFFHNEEDDSSSLQAATLLQSSSALQSSTAHQSSTALQSSTVHQSSIVHQSSTVHQYSTAHPDLSSAPVDDAQPTVTVLIAAYNESVLLPDTIDGVLAQSVQPDCLLVVDDGSSDDSLEILTERYGVVYQDGVGRSPTYPQLQILAKHHSGKADSLNAGLRLVQDDVVITLDADTQVKPGAIAAVRTYFAADPQLKVVGPLLQPVCAPASMGKGLQSLQRYEYLRAFTTQSAWSRIDSTLIVAGACAAYRRDMLAAVGGFDPDSWVEDYEVMLRIHHYCRRRNLRPKVLVSPYLTATTDAPNTLGTFIRQRRRWLGGFVQALLHHRHMVGNPKDGAVGLAYLVLGVVDACSPVYAIASLALIAFMVFGMVRLPLAVIALVALRWALDFLFSWVNVARHQQWQTHQWKVVNEGQPRWFNRRGALVETVVRPFVMQPLYQVSYWAGWLANLRGRLSW